MASVVSAPERLVVGRVRRAHGIQGEVMVESLTSDPEFVFAPGRTLRVEEPAAESSVDVTVESARPHKGGMLVRLEGVESRSAAEALMGRDLTVPAEAVAPLREGEIRYHDLVGLEVVGVDGGRIGRVVDIYAAAPADLLEVRLEGRTVLVPFSRQVVRDVDVGAGRLVIDPPEGLLDL